jgi:K+/H+ antiporter YhaU regulatory subunit KhtT
MQIDLNHINGVNMAVCLQQTDQRTACCDVITLQSYEARRLDQTISQCELQDIHRKGHYQSDERRIMNWKELGRKRS